MLNILNKIKTFRPLKAYKSSLSSSGLSLNLVQTKPRYSFSTKNPSQHKLENQVEDEDLFQTSIPFEDLVEKRVDFQNVIDIEKRKEELIEQFRETQMSPLERVALKQSRLEKKFGPNSQEIINARFTKIIDGLKTHKMYRPFHLGYQKALDNYQFKDGIDYDFLHRTDEYLATSRLSYLDLENSHIQSKFKRVLKEGEHYSKYEREYYAEDYLTGKPDNYIIVQNIPKTATHYELYNLFSKFGVIAQYNLKRSFNGAPAFFEVAYQNAESAQRAKREMNRVKYQDKTLYVKNNADSNYEHPVNRTLVISGIDRELTVAEILEELSNFGSVMHFEIVEAHKPGKLPTREELIKYLNEKNLSKYEREKVIIENHKLLYDGTLMQTETQTERFSEAEDAKPYYDSQVSAKESQSEFQERLGVVADRDEEKYRRIIFGDPKEKKYETLDDSAVALKTPNYYKKDIQSRNDSSISTYLKSIGEIEGQLTDKQFSLLERIKINNILDEPEITNKGYFFVTFATTDEAKRVMIDLPHTSALFHKAKVELKKDTSHIDHDKDYFYQVYEQLRERLGEQDLKLVERLEQLDEKAEFDQKIAEFREKTFDGKYKESLLKEPVKRQHIQPDADPQQTLKNLIDEERQVEQKVRSEVEEYLHKETVKQFSSKDRFELNLEEEDESYEVGRSFSTKVTKQDFEKFMNAVQNKVQKQQRNLLNEPHGYAEAVKELAEVHNDIGASNPEILNRFRSFIDEESKYSLAKKRIEAAQDLDVELEKIYSNKAIEAARKRRMARKRAEREAAAKTEDTYFDPFKKYPKVEKVNIVANEEERNLDEEYALKREKFMKKVRDALVGVYDKSELAELIEKSQAETRKNEVLKHYVFQTDKDGYQYITEADVERFYEDDKPTDPDTRRKYEALHKFMEEKKNNKWLQNTLQIMDEIPEVNGIIDGLGFPVESFVFEPSEDAKTIDELIDKLNLLDSEFTYVKSKGDKDEDIVVKLVQPKYKYDMDFFAKRTPEEFKNWIVQYLREQGIPEDYLNQSPELAADPQRLEELNARVAELLAEKIPKNILEALISPVPINDAEEFWKQLGEQNYLKTSAAKLRALDKSDFVKYSSNLFTPTFDGQFKRSEYDDI